MDEIKNVIILAADTLRRDTTVEAGIPDLLKGASFECVAQANCTPAAFPTIVTGLNPQTHLCYRFEQQLDPFTPTIFSILEKHKFETNYLSYGRDTDILKGYQDDPLLGYIGFPFDPSRPLEYFLKLDKRFMLMMHLWDAHAPFDLDMDGNEAMALMRNLYREGKLDEMKKIYLDGVKGLKERKIKPLLEVLEDSGRINDTLIVFLGDHGEMLGEKYDWNYYAEDIAPGLGEAISHVNILQPECVDVPLIFSHPSIEPGERETVARQVDLLPTLLDVLGVPYLPYDFEGINILNFKGILAAFTVGAHPHQPEVRGGKEELWYAEPLFLRYSVRVLDDYYVRNEKGEVLVNFKTKEKIDDDVRLDVLRAYANRFKSGRFKGIVKVENLASYSDFAWTGKEIKIIPPKGKEEISEEEKERLRRLRALGY